MRIAIHDGDITKFPNLALMKISAWHKAHGDEVEWFNALMPYDRVYSSKVFTFTPVDEYLPPDTIKGGTGYGMYGELDAEVDAMDPDYSIYPDCDFALGFLTRGCIRKCPWCCVSKKEGYIHPYRTWEQVKRPDSKKMVFMDNNILGCQFGIEQLESMVGQKVWIDVNQAFDARLVTPEIADIIAKLRWISFIRFACDTDGVLERVLETIELLKERKVPMSKLMVYVMFTDVASGEKRVNALRDVWVNPHVQPYRDFENKVKPTREQINFARYVNRKEIFKTCKSFEEYNVHYRRKGNAV